MQLNYPAFLIISFIPLLIGYLWYSPTSTIATLFSQPKTNHRINIKYLVLLFLFSIAIVYGYMNLIIHQLGFYELFFTDIMLGNEDSEK